MKTADTTGFALAAMCVALLAAGCTGGGTPRFPGPAPSPSAPPPGAGGAARLVVTTDNGVRLRPADDSAAHVSGHVVVHWSHSGGSWVLDLSCPRGGGACTRMPTVEVPGGTAVTVSARNAGIDVAGLTGSLDLSTVNGDVTGASAGRPAAAVRLATRNGSVRMTGVGAASLSATTVNGDVVLSCAGAPASVDAVTTNGSVDVTVPHGAPPYAVDASTRNGQRRVGVPVAAGAGHTMTLRTVNGDVAAAGGTAPTN
jgi:Putative adhesin